MDKNLIRKYFLSSNESLVSLGLLFLRCIIGVILFMVGSGKVLGWFGGFDMQATLQFYSKSGFSILLAYLSCYTEFIGGFLLIIGLFTRPAAFLVMINMIVATVVMLPKGFIFGGADFSFTLTIIAVIIQLAGPMAYSADYLIMRPENIIHELK